MTTPLGFPEIVHTQAQKYLTHNEALHHIDMWLKGVKSRSTDAPPGSPVEGDAYIITAAPSGDWSSLAEHDFALYFNGNWETFTAKTGPSVYVEDEDLNIFWDGAAYQTVSSTNATNTQTGTAYTLVLSDANTLVRMNNAAANTLTVPANADVEYPLATVLMVWQMGAGATSIVGDTGVTVNGTFSSFCILVKVDTDIWQIK